MTFDPSFPDQAVLSIVRDEETRAGGDRTFDEDETAEELADGSILYRDPTAQDRDRVPDAGRVTIIRPDGSVVVVSSYLGALSMEGLKSIALALHAVDYPPT